jgi:hypothetical protein
MFCYYVFTISKINSKKHTKMKKHITHRNAHPIHWHGTMILAIAAILLTSVKSSTDILRALHAVPTPPAVMDSLYMRDEETGHPPIILDQGIRHATASGR